MSILKLKPSIKDYLWGGFRLSEEYGKSEKKEKIAETWELSCYPGSSSVIENGEYSGITLDEYISKSGPDVIGSRLEPSSDFPILVKLIDARDDLSIQVHPDSNYARQKGMPHGKTEMWYILDTDKDAYIYYGFNREISHQEFRERIENNTFLEVMNKVFVRPGDVFLIDAGTLHSIGRGVLTAEVQQNSDVTYRIYDYARLDKNGNPRELHIEDALKVTHLKRPDNKRDYSPHLCKCEFFTVDRLDISGSASFTVDGSSFVHLLFIDGSGKISSGSESLEFKKGDSIFISAGSGEVSLEGNAAALKTHI